MGKYNGGCSFFFDRQIKETRIFEEARTERKKKNTKKCRRIVSGDGAATEVAAAGAVSFLFFVLVLVPCAATFIRSFPFPLSPPFPFRFVVAFGVALP